MDTALCWCYVVPMSTRMHITVEDELLAQIDAAKHPDVSRASFVRRAIQEMVASMRHGASRVDSLEVSPEVAEAFREKTSKVTQTKVADVLKDPAPTRAETEAMANLTGLAQFRCGVCGLKTIGGPCAKHGEKASEKVA